MPNKTRGVGLFTAENIVAEIRAIPETDGTYRDVARKAQQYGGNFHHHTISNWVSHGRADVEVGQPSTAYARFTKRYRDLVDENCQTGQQPEPRTGPGTRDPKTDLRVRQRQDATA